MDKIISYTDDIKKYMSGKEYSGKNIKTTDGKVAYVTSTGIVKPYSSDRNLSNLNGCSTNLQQINSTLNNLGMPMGTYMVDGQSCGNETKFVQSMPSDANFDWKYYIRANPDLQLTTEQQAYDHWVSKGIHEGLLPNQNFLSNMSNVGKIGYIDLNTNRRPVSSNDYQYTGDYKLFKSKNVTGTSMKDCIVPPPFIKYGDKIFIKYQSQYVGTNSQSIFELTAAGAPVYISSTDTNLYNTPLKYGDKFIMVAPSQAAYVNSSTSLLSIGPVGQTMQTFIVSPPPGTNFQNNAQIKYGDPIVIISISKVNWSEQTGIDYPQDDIGHSNKTPEECKAQCSETPGCAGFVAGYGNNCWMKSRFTVPVPNSNINAFMLDPAANTSVQTEKVAWDQIPLIDYPGNDITGSRKSLDDCKRQCQTTSGCVGIAAIKNTSGTNCYLKNKWANRRNHNNVDTYVLSKSNVILPQFKKTVSDKYSFGYISNNNIKFGAEKNSIGRNIFVFESATNPPYVAECNLDDLKNQCQRNSACNGIIHSEADKTWQMMMSNSMYKITPNPPNIYVKNIAVDGTKANFIDSNTFANYPYVNSNAVKGGTDGWNVENPRILLTPKNNYNNINNTAFQEGGKLLNKKPNISPYIDKTKNMYNQLNSKTNEYENVLTSIKKEKKKYNHTTKKQAEDLNILQKSNNIHVYLWGLSSIVVISMVVILKNKQ